MDKKAVKVVNITKFERHEPYGLFERDRKTHPIPPRMLELYFAMDDRQKDFVRWIINMNKNTKAKFVNEVQKINAYQQGKTK